MKNLRVRQDKIFGVCEFLRISSQIKAEIQKNYRNDKGDVKTAKKTQPVWPNG